MLATRIIGWISFFVIVGFLIFGFRQGLRAKAEARKNSGSSPGDSSGDSGRSP